MSNTRDSLDLDEIIQNIKDDAIAHHKKWQGSPYEAKQAIHQWATAEIIAELERLLTNTSTLTLRGYGGDPAKEEVVVSAQAIKDRIKYYKAKETQL